MNQGEAGLKIGDIVKVKGDAPVALKHQTNWQHMVIESVYSDRVSCQWFHGPYLQTREFSESDLVVVNEAKEKG
jgi:uncharacterized protein YodC (DUF2158 family)